MLTLGWTDEQNATVRDLIAEEVENARLSHKFIPELKVAEAARSVPAEALLAGNRVDDVSTIPLVELALPVNLTKLQAEDPGLSAALILIRRAANRLARAHDAVVFSGQPAPGGLPPTAPPNAVATGGAANAGLSLGTTPVVVTPPRGASYGEELVAQVAAALVQLETAGYIGSYVLILGQNLFTDANTPSRGSLVLPKDRLDALLAGGPVYRTSVLAANDGLLLSLGGEPMDRAVALAPGFEFLRIAANDDRQCRVFERFALRLKEPGSVLQFNRV